MYNDVFAIWKQMYLLRWFFFNKKNPTITILQNKIKLYYCNIEIVKKHAKVRKLNPELVIAFKCEKYWSHERYHFEHVFFLLFILANGMCTNANLTLLI